MKTRFVFAALGTTGALLVMASCRDQGARMGMGFRLPDGDASRGQAVFTDLKCHHCHTVEKIELPTPEQASEIQFHLGGEVSRVKTYGQLVTAIIQPQHIVSKKYRATLDKAERENAPSPMPDYNETMTVQQMTDLVTFLRGRYRQTVPDYDDEPYL